VGVSRTSGYSKSAPPTWLTPKRESVSGSSDSATPPLEALAARGTVAAVAAAAAAAAAAADTPSLIRAPRVRSACLAASSDGYLLIDPPAMTQPATATQSVVP
jgi:hypothetical protein